MLSLALLFILTPSVKGSGTPWYPVLYPVHTGSHRHTTHVVTHPVVHTRVLVLGDGEPQHHHHHHGHDHDHKHRKAGGDHHYTMSGRHRYSERDTSDGAPTPQLNSIPESRHQKDDDRKHGGHSYDDDFHDNYKNNELSQPEVMKYSMLISESPWKPLSRTPKSTHTAKSNHFPKARSKDSFPEGYLPLKYLGMDGEKVAKVVNEAINEIEKDMEAEAQQYNTRPRYPTGIQDTLHTYIPRYSTGIQDTAHTLVPRYPTGIQDLIGMKPLYRAKPLPPPRIKSQPPMMKPLPPMYRGAVFYDDVVSKGRYVHTSPGYVKGYQVHNDPSRKNALKLNVECQCQTPY